MSRPLKIYVWEDIFTDWYSGLAVALAPDVRTARREVARNLGILGRSHLSSYQELMTATPKVIRLDDRAVPQAWAVTGGG